jgi:hypothetical protein
MFQMPAKHSKNSGQQKSGSPEKARKAKDLKPITLSPLSLEEALKAAIATGPITDSELRAHKGSTRKR